MASMNPVIRIRQAFRSTGVPDEQSDEITESLTDHSFSRRETELMFQRERALTREQTERIQAQIAEFKTQVILAIFLATGLIIGAVGLLLTLID